jgi:hypothetical protein
MGRHAHKENLQQRHRIDMSDLRNAQGKLCKIADDDYHHGQSRDSGCLFDLSLCSVDWDCGVALLVVAGREIGWTEKLDVRFDGCTDKSMLAANTFMADQ